MSKDDIENLKMFSFIGMSATIFVGGTIGALDGFAEHHWYAWPCLILVLFWFIVGGVIFTHQEERP